MVKVTVNQASLARLLSTLRQYSLDTQQSIHDVVCEQGALLCRDLATFTPPLVKGGGKGLSGSAKKAGEQAVEGDIRKTFIAADDRSSSGAGMLLMRSAADATRRNDFAAFERIVNGGSLQSLNTLPPIMRKIAADYDRDRAFKKAKNYFARTVVVKNEYGTESFVTNLKSIHDRVKGRYGGRMKKGQGPRLRALVEKSEKIKEYARTRERMVGFVKSGWLTVLRGIPKPVINGMPKNFGVQLANKEWIARHAAPGQAIATKSGGGAKVILSNFVGDANGVATEADTLNYALENRADQMLARLRHFQEANINTADRK